VIKFILGLNADNRVGKWPRSQAKTAIHGPNMVDEWHVLRWTVEVAPKEDF
jgi:hypothetical protein